MDPEVALTRLRELLSNWEDERGDGSRVLRMDMVDMLDAARDLFTGLDEWLTRGGFLPHDWARKGGM